MQGALLLAGVQWTNIGCVDAALSHSSQSPSVLMCHPGRGNPPPPPRPISAGNLLELVTTAISTSAFLWEVRIDTGMD